MANPVLVVHERIGTWSRHLRPRLVGWPVRLVETRSAADLDTPLAATPCPLVLIDAAHRPKAALDDLDRALRVAPDALTLVLNPHPYPGVALLARELGATLVIDRPATPPEVAGWVTRWVPLAQKRTESAGRAWSTPVPPEPEPWCWLAPDVWAASAPHKTPRP